MQALRHSGGRALLALLTIWALAMIVPDLHRLVQPLGSFGLYANNDGVITDVQGPFADQEASPAYRAGLRAGDRLDLTEMRCIPVDTPRCASALAVLGGLRLVSVGRHAELSLAATPDRPARLMELVAEQRPVTWSVLAILLPDQLAAIAVVLAAAWLVWTRPGGMTWGFFLYVIWFNPGQSSAYYALLQHSPLPLLMQNIAGAIAEGAGYAGFILFALRVPEDESAPRWRPVERTLPAIAVLLAVLLALSHANLFGYPTELATRVGLLSGLVVAACAFIILLARRKELPPQDYQRLRWVIWGCLIGLPAIILSDIGEGTTLLDSLWGGQTPPEEFWGLLRLVNGVLCLFVFEAVRRPHVVAVAIPLRRVTILGFLLTAPTMLLHEQVGHMREGMSESVALPSWAWFAITVAVLFIISRLHESTVHLADRHFNRAVAKAGDELGNAILMAEHHSVIEAQLVRGAQRAFGLSSASIFRNEDGLFRRGPHSEGWDERSAETLDPADPMLGPLQALRPFDIDAKAAKRNRLPDGLALPVLAVPIADRFHCFALAFYGPHANGNDLNHDERAMLAGIADKAAAAFVKLNIAALRRRIADLEHEMRVASENPVLQ
ncbi:hypothetical protein SAMN05519103_09288 [Rhizobiales bacterium GAS113]|nr:hypothetical protein SAMN05519103_09288 [Rhizobiales bacterium GAS113]